MPRDLLAPKDPPLAGYVGPRDLLEVRPRQMGSILPVSRGEDGLQFDSNAGILGSIKRAFMLPGDVYTGKVQMNDPATGRTSDEAISRSMEMGAVFSPINPAVRAGDLPIPGMGRAEMRPANVAAPTADQLREAASRGYNTAREMGVRYKSPAVANLAQSVRLELEADGILAELAPKTFKILDKLSTPPAGSDAPLTGVLAARRALKNARMDFTNPTEKLAAERIIRSLDDFIGSADDAAVVAGPAAEAGRLVKDSAGNFAAAKRSDLVTGKLDKADRQAAVANSGLNMDNTIRQRANDILNSEKLQKGFSKLEIEMIRRVAEGDRTRNTVRFVSNLLGGGGGLGAGLSGAGGAAAGAALLGGSGGAAIGAFAVPAAGLGLKVAGGKMSRGAMNAVDLATRMRSPMYQQMLLNAPLEPVGLGAQSALMRGASVSSPALLELLMGRQDRR
jgi:hypothetical protein